MRIFITFILSLFIVSNALANGKKRAPVSIAFYTESVDVQSRKFSIEVDTPKGKRFISKIPFIRTSDIIAYHTFPSPHNPDMYGASFKLDSDATRRLRRTSIENKGKWIICMINGKVADMLLVDREVDGRLISVWRGVDPQVAKKCNKLVPRIGETKKEWKKRLKEEKKAKR